MSQHAKSAAPEALCTELANATEEYRRSVDEITATLRHKAERVGHSAKAYKARTSGTAMQAFRPPTK